jgi:hypothetical protein
VNDARNDWQRRFDASVEEADRRAEAAKPKWVRRIEPVAFAARAWWTVWLLLALVGFGLRAVGVRVPAAVGVPVFLALVAGLYTLMRREARERRDGRT